MGGSVHHAPCHCEEGMQVTDAAIHCMKWERTDNAERLLVPSGSPRAFCPRDDKMGGKLIPASGDLEKTILKGDFSHDPFKIGFPERSITPGLRLLAWPIWATAPLVQARRAPPFYPLVTSSFRS